MIGNLLLQSCGARPGRAGPATSCRPGTLPGVSPRS